MCVYVCVCVCVCAGLVSRDGQMRDDTLTCIGELAKAIPSKFEAILQRDFTE